MSVRDLDCLFGPASVALILSPDTSQTIRSRISRNLLSGGLDQPVTIIGPTEGLAGRFEQAATIESLDVTPDLAVLAVPPDGQPDALRALQAKGVKACALIATDFGAAPLPDQAGHAALTDAAGPMRLLGPDVLSLMVPDAGLNAGYSHLWAAAGDLAFVSQSGAIVTSVLDWAAPRGIGFSHMVSVGGQADVDLADILDYLSVDPAVRGILLYVQGITGARKFMSAARAAARAKPVIVIKSGNEEAAAQAVRSHTGALAGSDDVYDAAIRRAGMLRVTAMDELFDAVETLSSSPRVRGERMAILTNGGGMGVMAADELAASGGVLPRLAPETEETLKGLLPTGCAAGNPLDLHDDADGERYRQAVDAVMADGNVDALLVLFCPTAMADYVDVARQVASVGPRPRKAVFTSWIGSRTVERPRQILSDAGFPTYATPGDAVRGFMHRVRYQRNQEQLLQVPSVGATASVDRQKVRSLVEAALKDGRSWLSEVESKSVLSAYGIPVVETRMCADPAEAVMAASELGTPVAVKIVSDDVVHKSEVGGVVLDVDSPSEAGSAAEAMLTRLAASHPDAQIQGITVQKMARLGGAHELIVGLKEDPVFGPVILFGAGGKAAEVRGDTAVGLVPLNQPLAQAVIDGTRVARLLRGYSDVAPADRQAVVNAIVTVSRLATDIAEIKELDINPLLADGDGVVALDARIRLERAEGDPHDRLAIMPYPDALEGELRLKDGTTIPIRPIRPEDAHRMQRMVQDSDPEDLRMRFLHPVKALPEKLAARLSQIDYAREMGFVVLQPDDHDRCVGGVRLAGDPDGLRAEYAIMLRSDMKGRGLGRALMLHIIDFARRNGVEEIFGEVLAENRPMLTLCRNLGFKASPARDEPGVMTVRLTL